MSSCAIVLAAGLSKRFGTQNKLLIDWEGEVLIRRVVQTAVESVGQVVVVTGHEAESIETVLAVLPVQVVRNERYPEGMGTSIAAGIRAVPLGSGFLIVPGDMPRLTAATLRALAGSGQEVATCFASWGRTSPTYFAAEFRAELERLEGDVGAKTLLQRHRDQVWELPVEDAEVSDVD